MARSMEIPAGRRTRVFRRRFGSLPLTVDLEVESASGKAVSGTVERVGSRWILGRTRSTRPLEKNVRLSKGYWDTFFDIYVTPDQGVAVIVSRPPMADRRWLLGAAALIVIATAAVAGFALLG